MAFVHLRSFEYSELSFMKLNISVRIWTVGPYSVKISVVQLRELHCLLATVELYRFTLAVCFWSKVSQSIAVVYIATPLSVTGIY